MISIARLTSVDINEIAAAFALLGWNKPASQYQSYLDEQNAGGRHVLVARFDGEFCGYVTLITPSHCGEFSEMGIPEIADFNVLPKFRNRGIGTALMDAIEAEARREASVVGIAVGMTADYGAAQRMYVKRGYIPTGAGLFADGSPVTYGASITVDDGLLLTFTKTLVDG
ncbi:MAG: GNAT family N-acetyltransferase [Armatimonadota bacterium]